MMTDTVVILDVRSTPFSFKTDTQHKKFCSKKNSMLIRPFSRRNSIKHANIQQIYIIPCCDLDLRDWGMTMNVQCTKLKFHHNISTGSKAVSVQGYRLNIHISSCCDLDLHMGHGKYM